MPTKLYDQKWVAAAFTRMASEIEKDPLREGADLALIGVQTRGAEMADRLATILAERGVRASVGYLDPTMFRDDLHTGAGLKLIKPTEINFDINNRIIVLVDDVLLTGRSVRAAIDGLLHYGRPAGIRLCVMVDRGGRELPIQPDITGARIDVAKGCWVRVKLNKTDQREDAVYVVGENDEEP